MNYNMNINSPNFSNRTPPFRRSNEFLAPYISPVKSSYHVQQFSPHNYNNQQNLNKYEPSKMKYYTCSTPNSSSSNSYGSPYRFNRYNRNNRCSFASANISIYYDPTAMLNPWAELEKEWKGKKEQKLKSANAEDQNNLSE